MNLWNVIKAPFKWVKQAYDKFLAFRLAIDTLIFILVLAAAIYAVGYFAKIDSITKEQFAVAGIIFFSGLVLFSHELQEKFGWGKCRWFLSRWFQKILIALCIFVAVSALWYYYEWPTYHTTYSIMVTFVLSFVGFAYLTLRVKRFFKLEKSPESEIARSGSSLNLPFLNLNIFGKKKFKFGNNYEEVYNLSPYEFEHFIANLFKKMGYLVEVTEKSDGEEGGDYGADLIASKNENTIVIEVKKWGRGHLVGAGVIRSALGAMPKFKADKAIVITTSDFTEQAHEQARDAPVELWNGKYLKQVVEKYGKNIEIQSAEKDPVSRKKPETGYI